MPAQAGIQQVQDLLAPSLRRFCAYAAFCEFAKIKRSFCFIAETI
jgi:hypothetical protein